jgi:hypothetical protein
VRIVVVTIALIAIFSSIGAIFWYQEGKYLLPTPLPEDYTTVSPSELVKIDTTLLSDSLSKPTLFHFFSPDCPCSRFNLKHFLTLKRKYNNTINFYAVVTDETQVTSAKKMLDEDILVLVDKDKKLAAACGVYSTPQAAIVQSDNTLFFRGNYNRARYCTDKNSNFVQMALDSLVAKKSPPHFNPLATNSYGCDLSQTDDPKSLYEQIFSE